MRKNKSEWFGVTKTGTSFIKWQYYEYCDKIIVYNIIDGMGVNV